MSFGAVSAHVTMLILFFIQISSALHFHGGRRNFDWSKPVQTFGRSNQTAKPLEPRICRMRRDLIGWNRQQNHLLRRIGRVRKTEFEKLQLLRMYSQYAHNHGVC